MMPAMQVGLYILTLAGIALLASAAVPRAAASRSWQRIVAGVLAAGVFAAMPLPSGRRVDGLWLALLAWALASYCCLRMFASPWALVLSGVLACVALASKPVVALWGLAALLTLHATDQFIVQRSWRGLLVEAGWFICAVVWTQIWWPGYSATGCVALWLNLVGIFVLVIWSGWLARGDAATRSALALGTPVVAGTLLLLTLNGAHVAAMAQLLPLAPARLVSGAPWRTLAAALNHGPVSLALLITAFVCGAWQCRRAFPGLVVYTTILLLAAVATGLPPALLRCVQLGVAALAGVGAVKIIAGMHDRHASYVTLRCRLTALVNGMKQNRLSHTSIPTAPQARGQILALCAALVVLCALVFSNTLHNQFQLDDFYSITDNPGIQRVHPIWRHFVDPRTLSTINSTVQYRPLLPLTLSLNYALHGYALPGYHIFSIAVHALSAVLCFLFFLHLLRRWNDDASALSRTAIAWWAAALYAVHPIAGFPVNYLIARDLLMMQMFLLAALYVYVRLRLDGGAAWRWPLCLVWLVLSLCSKTNALAAPGMIILIEFVLLREPLTAWRAWRRVGIWVAVAAGFLAWVQFGVGFSDADQLLGGNRTAYLLTQFRIHLFNYLRNVVWPFEIRALPWVPTAQSLWEWRVLLGALVIFGSIAVALALVRRRPLVSFCILAYWGMAALESSIFPLHIIATDYRTYPSLPYVCLLIVLAIARFPRRRLATGLLAALLVYFGASAFFMNRHFRTGETFWRQSVRYGTHALGTMNYGMSLRGKDDAEALKYLQRAAELNPNYYLGRINLGLCYLSLGRRDEGIAEAKYGAACAPELCKDIAYFWLGQAYKCAGDITQAYEAVRTALTYNQHNIEYLYEGAYLAQQCSDHAAASAYLSNIHTRVENYQISRFLAGWSYQARGLNEAALTEYERAIAYTPNYAQTYANKGYALYALGRYEEAARAFEEHLRRVPGNEGSLISLSNCLERLQRDAP